MKWRRLTITLLLNLIVSAGATLGVLVLWDRYRQPIVVPPTPQAAPPTSAPAAAVPDVGALEPADTPLPGFAPSVTPTIHIVETGDTLGSIALNYDISIEEIMDANGLTNPDVLSVGQALVIPVGGLPDATPTSEPLGASPAALTPIPTTTEAPSSGLPNLAFRSVDNPGIYESEKVTIVNLGGAVQLGGWVLAGPDGATYTFPALRLHENGQVSVHTAVGQNSVTDLYWGQSAAIWQPGMGVRLLDPNGVEQATLTVP